ncbi:hypothetical protein F5Y08DRAFT_338283 [Xylaria arbuscula]|nr:hypothetical protein F5Y08DRAFT_338283 [Xylaria arbuscula]
MPPRDSSSKDSWELPSRPRPETRSSARTILESFTDPLPKYEHKYNPKTTQVALSGNSTKETDPPKFWVDSGKNWVNEGNNIIKNHHNSLQHLERQFISNREESIHLLSEGDVTRAAALYLLHPVNQALSALRSNISCLSEATDRLIRTDICYKGGESTFAVLEIKKRGAIDKEEFGNAKKKVDLNDRQAINKLLEQISDDGGDSTLFSENSRKLMKQATNYAERQWATHVALFDWDHLVLVSFTFREKQDPKNKAPKRATSRE